MSTFAAVLSERGGEYNVKIVKNTYSIHRVIRNLNCQMMRRYCNRERLGVGNVGLLYDFYENWFQVKRYFLHMLVSRDEKGKEEDFYSSKNKWEFESFSKSNSVCKHLKKILC